MQIKIPVTLALLFGFSSPLFSNDLSQIQEKIRQQESKIAEQKKVQQQLQSELKRQESHISSVLGLLKETEAELSSSRKLIEATDRQIKHLEKQEQQQKQMLAKQLDATYRSELSTSDLKRLFDEQAKQSDRIKQYYAHLNQARLKLITNLQQTQDELSAERENLQKQIQTQKHQLETQKSQQQSLQKAQKERLSTLSALNRTLSSEQAQLENLRANENTLRQEIQRAEQKAKALENKEKEAYAQKKQLQEKQTHKPYKPTEQEKQLMANSKGLGKPARQYVQPVSGKVIHPFGSVQMGEITWKGMVFAAPAGTAVRAITNGRVIFAQWFSGHGLMVMVKHGESDLSLYGYNQSINVKEGQWVKAGDKLAEVGNSGGQPQPSLYFAIRRKGIAVNPAGWLK